MAFKKAERKKAKLRLALTGPSGSGKTFGALKIAQGLGGKIAVVDTERGSASLYANWCEFDVLELDPPYTPEAFTKAMREAEQGGYDVLILDSTTHEWSGVGGCLELVDEVAKARYRGNTWSAWSEVTPRHRAFVDAIQRSPMHIIATMRSKTETAQVEENGRKKVVKLGMKAEQRDGIEYEMSVVLDVQHDSHYVQPSKDRTGLFMDRDPFKISEQTGVMLREWLESGAEPSQEPSGVTAQELADWQAAIESAADMDALVSGYKAAVKLARERKDKLAEDAFVATKDRRKKQLEAPPQSEFQDEDILY